MLELSIDYYINWYHYQGMTIWILRKRSKAFCICLGVLIGETNIPSSICFPPSFISSYPITEVSASYIGDVSIVCENRLCFLLYTLLKFSVEFYILASLELSYETVLSLVETKFVLLELLLCLYLFEWLCVIWIIFACFHRSVCFWMCLI